MAILVKNPLGRYGTQKKGKTPGKLGKGVGARTVSNAVTIRGRR